MCNEVQIELWGSDPDRYPPRTIVEVDRLNDDDIVEVEGTFHNPAKVQWMGRGLRWLLDLVFEDVETDDFEERICWCQQL